MAQACATEDVPAACEIYLRMSRDEAFASAIARARAFQQHSEVDKTVDLADTATAENWGAVQVQIRARQWRAAKLLPKVYGDKMLHTGADGEGPIAVKLSLDYSRLEPHELVQLRALIEKATPRAEAPLMLEAQAEEEGAGRDSRHGVGL